MHAEVDKPGLVCCSEYLIAEPGKGRDGEGAAAEMFLFYLPMVQVTFQYQNNPWKQFKFIQAYEHKRYKIAA